MTSKRWLAALILLTLALGSTAASAANLLQNGTFDTNTAGWTNLAVWDSRGNPGGSDKVALTTTGAGTSCTDSIQVVAVSGGNGYNLSADMMVAPSPETTAAGRAYVDGNFCSDANCAAWPTTIVGNFQLGPADSSNALNTWLHVGPSLQIAPANARAAIIFLNPCIDAAGTFTALFDNVVFEPAPTAQVPTLGGAAMSILVAALAVAAFLALGRSRT